MLITMTDPFTGYVNTMNVECTHEQFKAWKGGAMVQDAMPDVPAEQREFLMTGIMPTSWKETFGGIDDDVDDE